MSESWLSATGAPALVDEDRAFAVDRIDDNTVTHPAATQAQPEPFDDAATLREMQELFGTR